MMSHIKQEKKYQACEETRKRSTYSREYSCQQETTEDLSVGINRIKDFVIINKIMLNGQLIKM